MQAPAPTLSGAFWKHQGARNRVQIYYICPSHLTGVKNPGKRTSKITGAMGGKKKRRIPCSETHLYLFSSFKGRLKVGLITIYMGLHPAYSQFPSPAGKNIHFSRLWCIVKQHVTIFLCFYCTRKEFISYKGKAHQECLMEYKEPVESQISLEEGTDYLVQVPLWKEASRLQ